MISDRVIIHEGREIGMVKLTGFSASGSRESLMSSEWWRAYAPDGRSTTASTYQAATAWLIQRDAEQKMEQR